MEEKNNQYLKVNTIILPCGLSGGNISCIKDCKNHKNKGNYKKIDFCYEMLKKAKVKREKHGKNK